MVQKGKLSAVALPLESALNSVDLPTLGKPMMPYLRAIKKEDYGVAINKEVTKKALSLPTHDH
jgi:hypothetical protein